MKLVDLNQSNSEALTPVVAAQARLDPFAQATVGSVRVQLNQAASTAGFLMRAEFWMPAPGSAVSSS